mgnify:FL=1
MPQPAVRLSVGLTVSHAGTGISDRFGSRMRTMGNDPRRAGAIRLRFVIFRIFCDFPVVPGILSDKEGVCNRMYRAVNRSPKFGCFEDKSYFCRRNFFKRFR